MLRKLFLSISIIITIHSYLFPQSINREALVKRHNIKISQFDSLTSLSLGNGDFIFTADATGLQTFPEIYKNGLPLGTWTNWAWHSCPNVSGYNFHETLKDYNLHDRKISYSVPFHDSGRNQQAAEYFEKNPHRLPMGLVGFEWTKPDGSKVTASEIKNINQELHLWEGRLQSNFEVMNMPVNVTTYSHGEQSLIAVEVHSPLIRKGLLKIKFQFRYPGEQVSDSLKTAQHQSLMSGLGPNSAFVQRKIDSASYVLKIDWNGKGALIETNLHEYTLVPGSDQDKFSFSFLYSPEIKFNKLPDFITTNLSSKSSWGRYWQKGGIAEFSECTDPRAIELERRVILSQYIMKVYCSGSIPQELLGSTPYNNIQSDNNLWLASQFALWGKTELLEKNLVWYKNSLPQAIETAKRQGYNGARWPSLANPSGMEKPSQKSLTIWQQPNIIYLAELHYRLNPDRTILSKYHNQVSQTADFMASYTWFEKEKERFVLGPTLAATQKPIFSPEAMNPTFELAYWHWALSTAQLWEERLHLPRIEKWDTVLSKLSNPPITKGIYLLAENTKGTRASFEPIENQIILGAWSFIPKTKLIDSIVFKNTFNFILKKENYSKANEWGANLIAMTATRLGYYELAIETLLSDKGKFLKNGLYVSDKVNLSGNGSLLMAVAMMCAGFDGCKTENPGFPKNNQWNVKWEELAKLP